MSKKNQFIKAVGLSTAIVISNAIAAKAEDTINQLNQDSASLLATSPILAQSTDNTTNNTTEDTQNILKPAQTPISDTEELNPSEDPLSLPNKAEEVEVDLQKPITLEQAIELSLRNNKDVQATKLQVEQSSLALREARGALFPTLDVGSSLNYRNAAFRDSFIDQRIDQQAEETGLPREQVESQFADSQFESFDFDASVTLSYSIYNGGQRGAAIRASQKQLKSSELELERITEQTTFETSRDYYNLQNSDAQVEIEKAAVDDANQTLKDAQLLEKAGLGTRFDVLRAEVELAQAQQRLSTAQANQNISRRQLAETLSVSHDTDLSTADKIEEAGSWSLSLSESIVQAFNNRAELEQLILQKEISTEQRKIALSQVRPSLSANASYSTNDDFSDEFDLTDQYQIGLSLQWRLFDGGAARASARQSDKDGEIAETQFANQRNQIRFAVEQAFYGLEANKKNIGTATKEVELAEESLRLARLRFQAGVGTQTDVIEAQTQLTAARGNLLSSIIDYNQSYADLQRQVSNVPENDAQEAPQE